MSEYFKDHFSSGLPVTPVAGLAVGMMVETDTGPRAVETLKCGDLVQTLDDGLRPVKAVVRQSVRGTSGTAPVRFATGVFGAVAPLIIAPQHCVVITGWQAELYFGQDEVLIDAAALINGTTITRLEQEPIDYIDVAFDTEQIMLVQGIGLTSLPMREGLSFGCTEAAALAPLPQMQIARPLITAHEAQVLHL